jgi:ankyrin repeat protein
LLLAVQDGDIERARKRLHKGFDPDAKDNSKSTPLHYAVKGKNLEMVDLLLEYGADPDATGDSDRLQGSQQAKTHAYEMHAYERCTPMRDARL